MATLVFDITTIGAGWESLDSFGEQQLTRYASADEAEDSMGLSPVTGKIFAVSLFDVERRQTVVYCTHGDESEDIKIRSEKELLEDFWEGARSYDVFATFGGRRFDIPFLLLRSTALGVSPSIEFPNQRLIEKQNSPYHIDLYDQYSQHGTLKNITLHLLCQEMQVESPDDTDCNGAQVQKLFREEKYDILQRYAKKNVAATTELYSKWFRYLSPQAFKNLVL